MAKEKEDPENGFKVGDIVKHKKSDVQGRIHDFCWGGARRAAIETKIGGNYYIVDVLELELVNRPTIEPKEITKTEKDLNEK